jgi:hypothetical protein
VEKKHLQVPGGVESEHDRPSVQRSQLSAVSSQYKQDIPRCLSPLSPPLSNVSHMCTSAFAKSLRSEQGVSAPEACPLALDSCSLGLSVSAEGQAGQAQPLPLWNCKCFSSRHVGELGWWWEGTHMCRRAPGSSWLNPQSLCPHVPSLENPLVLLPWVPTR